MNGEERECLELGDDAQHVVVHRTRWERPLPCGCCSRTVERYDWFVALPGEDRWVAFHRSEHLDVVSAWVACRHAEEDRRWTTAAVGRSRPEIDAAPATVADLQRLAIAALREAHGEEALRRGDVAWRPPAAPSALAGPSLDRLPPLEAVPPPDPEAGQLPLSAVFGPAIRGTLARHGMAMLGDVARLSQAALDALPGLTDDERRVVARTLLRHGLLLAPERPAGPAERRAARLREAAGIAELLARGYRLDEIARHTGRSPRAVRLLLAERAGRAGRRG